MILHGINRQAKLFSYFFMRQSFMWRRFNAWGVTPVKISDAIEHERQHNKDESKPLGHLCKLCVQRLCLALGEEGLCAAGDRTGQAGTLAALHKNDDGHSKTGENLKNREDNSKGRHLFQSFPSCTN